ncbi:MAG TPA: hypothetical protein VIG73_03175 [Cerasibacillus sp.]|uniref:hypothetical protein n=1 Tax=Cerasibacillus sp. TaxID=2498711 RepID=UPI002F3EA1A3
MTYQIMFYGGLIGIFLSLPLVIFLFIRLQIIEVFEDLTGLRIRKKTREQLEVYHLQTSGSLRQTSESIRIRKQYTTGHQSYTERSGSLKPIAIGQAQSAAPVNQSTPIKLQHVNRTNESDETALLNEVEETELLQEDAAHETAQLVNEGYEETELLQNGDYGETALLEDEMEETALLNGTVEETMLLDDADETTLLTDDETALLEEEDNDFILQKNIIIVHSKHIIGEER